MPTGALSVSLQASKAEWGGLHTDQEILLPKLWGRGTLQDSSPSATESGSHALFLLNEWWGPCIKILQKFVAFRPLE